MYLKGSKWSLKKRRQRQKPNYWRIFVLCMLIAAAVYVNQVIVPVTPPLFIPTLTPTRPPESYVAEAEAFLNEGKMSQAIQAYGQAIQSDPDEISNYLTVARLQIFSGDYENAVVNAENALLLSPNNSTGHALRGWALSFLDDYLNAEASLRKAIDLDSTNAAAYAYLAELLVRQSNSGEGGLDVVDRAIEASRTAINKAPNMLESHRARGLVLELTGNYKEAIDELSIAIEINSNIADLHLALGRNYRNALEYALAVEEFNRANALNPADPTPDLYISRTYATVGEYAKAIQFAQQAVKNDPTDPYLYGNLGTMYYKNYQYTEATEPLEMAVRGGITEDDYEVEAIKLDYGRSAEYYYTYGLALAKIGQCGEALKIAQTLQQGVPSDEIAVYNAQEMITTCQQIASGATSIPSEENEEIDEMSESQEEKNDEDVLEVDETEEIPFE